MEKNEAFLLQARSDFRVFELLWDNHAGSYPECHALQHLQMSTEKLAKSILSTFVPTEELMSHVALRRVVQRINRPQIIQRLGYDNPRSFRALLDRRRDWFQEIEQLSPSVGTEVSGGSNDGPNVEYPWQARGADGEVTWRVPADHVFDMARNLRTGDGQQFLDMVRRLLDRLPHALLP